ncbi:bifunctional UDP-sugar hydrolase/5'-nucleotidase [Actinomyces sp. MRS3W]|uniref:bifunctional metallophosphatase/5'-nucleotidase n=1 Tax=Actinomyces sp. MRS3W TaxID=2800796 RepID=UPI0028FD939C|nr:bifunctional UDP-sugar hydrolase/5'-nucleotidase [Actinomyces sp. MRS3W]MDU0349026.1 bifunctional UDP-sugar hydrolase/5'-nucleotidase [Actinomyces sp. MRS3W]
MRPHLVSRAAVSLTALALVVFAPSAAATPVVGSAAAVPADGPVGISARADSDGGTVINLLGITDFGGHIERVSTQSEGTQVVSEPGAVTLACEVAAAREAQPDTLLVSAGDNVGGSAYVSSVLDDQPTIDILGAIGLDVTAAGNHEFDRGVSDLSSRLAGAFDAPILAANVTGDAALSAQGDGDGVWTTEVGDVTVAFVGVVTDELPSLVAKQALEGVSVANAVEVANARAAALKDGKADNGEADVVVVLAHEDADVYGPQFNGSVDAVVGGHTHAPYAATVTGKDGNRIAIVQPGQYGNSLGNITLSVDPDTGSVSVLQVKNIDLTASTCTTDAYGVQAIVDQAVADSREAGARVLATLDTGFYRGTNDGSDPGANRSTESTAADVIADSYRAWLTTDIQPEVDHYIGLMNPGGVRADYLPGELTEGEAYTVQPFGNEMGYATYSGAQVKDILAQQWQPGTSRPLLMLGVSGNVQVYIDQDAAEELEGYWSRISAGTQSAADLTDAIEAARGRVIRSVYVDDAELADDAEVVVASNSFMLSGGDGFTILRESTPVSTGVLDRAVTAQYVQTASTASADLAKRQIGVDLDTDSAGGTATVRLTGLNFTAASERSAPGAAQEVTATVALADGGTQQLTSAVIDTTITADLPETGTATLRLALPDDVATSPCPTPTRAGVTAQTACAVVSFTLVNRDGSTRSIDLAAHVPAAAAASPADSAMPPVSDQVIAVPGDDDALAETGVPAFLGSVGVMSATLLVAGGTACYRVVRRASRAGVVPYRRSHETTH